MYAILFSVLFLIVGLLVGWIGQEAYTDFMNKTRHDFEDLFKENPHPEIFDEDGKPYRGDYMVVNFEPGFDPETDWNPEALFFDDEDEDY